MGFDKLQTLAICEYLCYYLFVPVLSIQASCTIFIKQLTGKERVFYTRSSQLATIGRSSLYLWAVLFWQQMASFGNKLQSSQSIATRAINGTDGGNSERRWHR